MGVLVTSADLLDDALKKAGEKTDGTSGYEVDALKYLNVFHQAILSGGNKFDVNLAEPWSWAKSKYPGVLILEPAYTTGTVSLTQDSTSGTFSSAPSASQQGKFLKISDRVEYYRISSHIAGETSFTLDSSYAGSTGTGLFYSAIKLDYDLATNVMRLIGAMKVCKTQQNVKNDPGKIEASDFRAFDRAYPWSAIEEGIPTEFCEIYKNTDTGLITVRFNKYPAEKTRVEYDHITYPSNLTDSATSIPLIPLEYREVLSDCVAHQLLVDKEDTKADYYLKAAKAGLFALVNNNRKNVSLNSKNRGQFFPRMDGLKSTKITSGS